ncbi:MAG: LysE family translocator [Hyphomicrobiaceae bacterium]|nr:LysE family translocator [Caulobacteraceae bacterium]
MSADLLFALTVFAFVASITPGPNNMMLLASGVNFGFRRTVPHMAGITVGFMVMMVLVGVGIGQVLEANQTAFLTLKIAGCIYMVWLAWKIARGGPISADTGNGTTKPLTFMQAALFQWVNPKGWAMVLTATAAYTDPANFATTLAALAIVFGAVCIPSVGTWTLFGVGLRKLLQDPVKVRIFNILMAALLLVSMLPAMADFFVARG